MSYIGNPIVSTDFPKDTFSGNGSTTAFTMSIAPASVNAVIIAVSGVVQDPSTYTISGTTLTFSGAPPSGTNNISVRHLGVAGTPQVPALGSVVPASMSAGAPSWDTSKNLYLGSATAFDQITGTNVNINAPTGQASKIVFGINNTSTGYIYNNASEVAIGYPSSGSLKVQLSGTGNVLVSDSAGRVTTPLQPSFFAYLPNTVTVNSMSGWGPLTSSTMNMAWSTQHNITSSFNTTTGRFTAPIAGRYEFNFVVRAADNQGQDKVATIQVWVNNSNLLYSDWWAGYSPGFGGGYRPTISASAVIELAAGDYVNMAQFNATGSTIANYATWFSGRLLG